ncbi:MAG: tRNA (N(6)-L-threonylcarbamoyladenosine(37)-C(2))-methylthiotransferase [Thermoplasmata archaeon]|nr:tRNA (N(6)-L-threonylcarbamoyladenosine(37)-C(2))-methylthiotransferase [Thermoplasmata archaeon]
MRIYIEVYGCAANRGDASIIEGMLLKEGHEIVENIKDADVAIILTCTVIDTTQQRMIHRIKELKKEGEKLIVAGCMASAQPEIVKKIGKDILLLPPRDVHKIVELLNGKKVEVEEKAGLPRKADLRLNVPIADGCLYSCSYCITKKARGNLTSYSMDKLVNDIKEAIKNGCKEIRLTSQDTASYGFDSKDYRLPDLINEVANIEGEFMIRVGMMHPLSAIKILDELLEAYKNEKVYKFLHLPLQSASPKILKEMRRGYTYEMFKEIVDEFRKKFDNLHFATDIIVAFPGESEEDFQMTVEAIKELKPDVVNITRFSPRPNTPAAKMKKLPTQVAKERSRKLTCVVNQISYENNLRYVGKIYKALILEEYKEWKVGKIDNYKSVFVDKAELGKFIKVKTISATSTHLNAISMEEK